jgi:putative transposase
MAQSLSAVYLHLVFSTKERQPFFRDCDTREALHAYLGGISKTLDCQPIIVGGMEDHFGVDGSSQVAAPFIYTRRYSRI